jgi:hypothetical protein
MLHSSRRLTGLLGLLLLAVAVCAPAAFTQSSPPTYTYDTAITNQVTVNSCAAGEPVSLNGTLHLQYSFTTDATTGVNQFSITASNNLVGVGQTTGTNYTASDSSDYIVSSSQPSTEAVVEFKSDLTSQGSAPSMTLVQTLDIVVDVTGNVSAQVTGNTTQCGN